MVIYLSSKISLGSNGSDVRWKAIPQMCSTVAEATFQKVGTGLRQSQFVITIPSFCCENERDNNTASRTAFYYKNVAMYPSLLSLFWYIFFPSDVSSLKL